MALEFTNRAGFVATSTGTGSFVQNTSLTGFKVPSGAIPAMVDGGTYNYIAYLSDLSEWAYGTGVWTVSTSTLTRVDENSVSGTVPYSFSSPPNVIIGNMLAQNQVFVKLGDTTVSSPTASITVPFPTDTYSLLKLVVVAGSVDLDVAETGQLYAEITNYDNMFIGVQSVLGPSGIVNWTAEVMLADAVGGYSVQEYLSGTSAVNDTVTTGTSTPGATENVVFQGYNITLDAPADLLTGRYVVYGMR